jgi:hypothetical protein
MGEAAVESCEREIEGFGDSDVPGIVTGDVGAQLPDALREGSEGVELDVEAREVAGGSAGLEPTQLSSELETPEHVGHLRRQEMRRRQAT